MTEPAAAPEVTGQPEAGGQVSGQPDGATERTELETKLSEANLVIESQRHKIAGSQKVYDEAKNRGYESFDEVFADLDRVGAVKSKGIDLDQLAKAFAPEQVESLEGAPFDLEKFEANLLTKVSDQIQATKTADEKTQRDDMIRTTVSQIGEMVKTKIPDASTRDLALAQKAVTNDFWEAVAGGEEPAKALESAWSGYESLDGDTEGDAKDSALEAIAKAATKTKPIGTKKGGQGEPPSNKPGKSRAMDKSDLVAELAQRMKAQDTGKVSDLS